MVNVLIKKLDSSKHEVANSIVDSISKNANFAYHEDNSRVDYKFFVPKEIIFSRDKVIRRKELESLIDITMNCRMSSGVALLGYEMKSGYYKVYLGHSFNCMKTAVKKAKRINCNYIVDISTGKVISTNG